MRLYLTQKTVHFFLNQPAIRIADCPGGSLNRQFPKTLQNITHVPKGRLGNIRQVDSFVSVHEIALKPGDLGAQRIGVCQPRRIVPRTVDLLTGTETGVSIVQLIRRTGKVSVDEKTENICIDPNTHLPAFLAQTQNRSGRDCRGKRLRCKECTEKANR